MKYLRVFGAVLLAAVALSCIAVPARAGEAWQPVNPADLAAKAPVVEKDADAEALFWDVRVQDREESGSVRSVLNHYIRIKVYTDRGKESVGKVDIPYANGTRILDIAARTIKPDGSVVELKPDAIFDREIIKAGRFKIKAKSFALPAVEPGVVVEYRWKETRPLSAYTRLQFQREIPVQKVVYHIKPFYHPAFPYGMRTQTFHGQNSGFVKEDGGFYMTSMTNVPAFREEPHMPPEDQVRPWLLMFYSEDTGLTADKFWTDYGKRLFNAGKSAMKVNDDVRKAAAEIVGDASAPEQKIERLYTFCRTKIKNMSDDALGLTDEEREKLKENKNPVDTLKRGQGSAGEVNLLFAALCNAAGLDARLAALPDRSDFFFDPSFPDDYFLSAIDVAVKTGDQWRLYDPASTYVPFGMLVWREEGVQALVADPKEAIWIKTPLSAPDRSREKRVGTLALAEDGTLEGDLRLEYTGHLATELKEYYDDETPARREELLREQLKDRLSTAELGDVKFENVTDPDKPLAVTMKVRVPGYAQRTGKRLFLQPAFFQRNEPALFQSASRLHMVYFHYPWSEEDDITVKLPAGYALDTADAPEPFNVGAVGEYKVKILATTDSSMLQFKRTFFFGGNESLYFPAASYQQLKLVFDTLHQRDAHTITLKQTGAN
jgi:hypothetical protein